jgi:trigger factor
MKTELLGQEKNVVKIKIEFEADEFTQGLKKAVKDLSQRVTIPGFRKGHTPRKIIEMRFGREALYNDTLEDMIDVRQIADDYELDLIDSPTLNIDFKEIHEGEPVVCTLNCEVMPEVELPDIENIEVEKLRTNVTEEMVDRLVRSVRKENAEVKPVERAVEGSDLVNVELTVEVIEPEADARKEEPHKDKLDLFDESIRPEIRDALIGKNKGDTAEAVFDVEEGHQQRQYAGKKLRYNMKVEEVSEYILPELNEEFYVKLFGNETDIHTEEDFRNRMRSDLTKTIDDENRNDAEYRALMEVVKQSKVEVPETMIERQAQKLRRADEEEAKNRYGVELAEVFGRGDKNWEKDYMAVRRTRAEAMVRQSLVVDTIGKKYEVEVEKEDVDAELRRRAGMYNMSKDALAGYYYKNESAMNALTDDVRYGKITGLLLEKVRVKDVDELSAPAAPDTPQGGEQN